MISVTKKGFSFVELLLVVIIMGIITAMAVPRAKVAYDKFQLANLSKDIYYFMQYLQNTSIVERKVYSLNIDREKAEFTASRFENGNAEALKGRFARPIKAPGSIKVGLEPDVEAIYFYPNGRIDEFSIVLTSKAGNKETINSKNITDAVKKQ